MKPCAPLSPAARELLALGSHVEPPRSEQLERMDRAVARLVALEGAAPPDAGALLERRPLGSGLGRHDASGVAAPAWRTLRDGLGSSAGKLALALGALAATASASFWMGRVSAPAGADAASDGAALLAPALGEAALAALAPGGAVPARPVDEAAARPVAVVGEPVTANVDRLVRSKAGEPGSLGSSPSARGAMAPAQPARPKSAGGFGLAAEIERLARAEAALRQGRARRALAELEPPATHLVEQAAALRAVADCALGERASAGEVLQRWPASVFAARIRAECGL